jgi:hypothetical protein
METGLTLAVHRDVHLIGVLEFDCWSTEFEHPGTVLATPLGGSGTLGSVDVQAVQKLA